MEEGVRGLFDVGFGVTTVGVPVGLKGLTVVLV